MRHKKWFLIGMAVVVFGGVAFFTLRLTPYTLRRHAEKAVYYCPMHPTYTSDRPGDCPICNMKLVKKESTPEPRALSPEQTGTRAKDICYMHNCPMAHEGKPCPMLVVAKEGEQVTCPICGSHVAETAEAGSRSPEGYALVLVTPQMRQLIGVTTALASRRAMTKTIRTVGRIAYDPALYQAEAEYVQAMNGLLEAHGAGRAELVQQATAVVEASRMRLRLMGLSDELVNEMTGWSGPDARLLLNDPQGQVWVYASVYEFELPIVQVGSQIAVDAPALGGASWTSTVRAVDAVLDPTTRSARVRAVLEDPQQQLKPEMFVNASISVDLGDVLAIPESAALNTGTRRIVYSASSSAYGDTGIFEPRDVVLGQRADGFEEVRAGVAEGERVVTSGNFLIDSESRLKAALQGMTPATSEQGKTGAAQAGEHRHGQ
jgi:Cu(I)/Ag(I) efflux system membrane fusion protein